MDIYITQHALNRAQQRLGLKSRKRVMSRRLLPMIFGKRVNNSFLYKGGMWGFNAKLDTLKTVYLV